MLFTMIFSGAPLLRADMALLLHQPHSTFGFFNPTGHTSVYLSRVCAESHVQLRRCRDGELGVAISRYNRIAGYDWVAIPIIPYLYAVEHPEQAPAHTDRKSVAELRDAYRRNHLRELTPDTEDGVIPKGDWPQLVGAAYDRKIYGFAIETDEAADDALIEFFNSRANKRRFNLLFQNCADFSKGMINFYYPKTAKRNIIADIGITTPKQISRSLVKFSKRNPDLRFSTFIIPQVSGNIKRSTAVHGVIESLIRSPKYVVPIAVASPWAALGGAAAYITGGRFNPEKYASEVLAPETIEEYLFNFSDYHNENTFIADDGEANEREEECTPDT